MNELVRASIKDLDKQAEALAKKNSFASVVTSDMYTEEFNLIELTYFTHMIPEYIEYTMAQVNYILDKAITIATL